MANHTVEIGNDTVLIDKVFGPTIFAPLRVTADPARGWIIERELGDAWLEWCVLPAQLDADFAAEDATDYDSLKTEVESLRAEVARWSANSRPG